MARFLSIVVILGIFLASCSVSPRSTQTPSIMVSFSVLGDIVQNVVGDAAQVDTIVGPNNDAHAYEPTPQDGAKLDRAAAVVTIGLGFEPWLDELYRASGAKAPNIISSARIPAHEANHGDMPQPDANKNATVQEYDPHIWHDVRNAIVMVETIRDGLTKALPSKATTFRANSDRYIAELQLLDADIVSMVAKIPAERRKLVTNHDTFGYFAQRYGFVVVGTILGVSTESSDPSATKIVALSQAIRDSGVPAIFIENMSNSALITNVAKEAGVEIAPSLYTDALGELGSAGATYASMMRYNVTTMSTSLQGN